MSDVVVSMLLARHGETRDNAHGLILGRRDPPLSPAGQEQAARLAARVASEPVAAIWCSPLLRARQTATVVADAIGVAPTVLEDLIESDRGSWEGRPVAELAARYQPGAAVYYARSNRYQSAEHAGADPRRVRRGVLAQLRVRLGRLVRRRVRRRRAPERQHALYLYTKTDPATAMQLASVTGLGSGLIPVRLDIDPTALTVGYALGGSGISGSQGVPRIGVASTDQWATVVAYSAAANLGPTSVEVCPE